jgi:hypothetical protein
MIPHSRPSHDAVHAEFLRQLEECTVKPDWPGGRNFIRVGHFTSWMRSRTQGQYLSNTARLLRTVYPNSIQPPISADTITSSGNDCCVLVFSILLEIGLGHYINEVQRHEVIDRKLPVDLYHLKWLFEQISPKNYLDYAQRFNNAQWKFSPMTFWYGMDKIYSEEYVIPICRKHEIGRGGQGRVYGIAVQAEFVSKTLHNTLPKKEPTRYDDPDYGPVGSLKIPDVENQLVMQR